MLYEAEAQRRAQSSMVYESLSGGALWFSPVEDDQNQVLIRSECSGNLSIE